MGNCPEFIILLIGILRSGAVAVPLNHFLTPPEADGILKDAQATVVFSDADRIEARSSMPHWGSATSWWDKRLALELSPPKIQPKHANDADYSAQADDLAVLIYTSGTTGQPKGAMLSHENLLHNTASCAATMETTPEDRVAVVLPLFHSFMLTVGVLLPLQSGGSIVLLESLHPASDSGDQPTSGHHPTTIPHCIAPWLPCNFRLLPFACASAERHPSCGNPESIQSNLTGPHHRKLWPQRSEPCGHTQSHSWPHQGRFHRHPHQRGRSRHHGY